MDVLNFETSLEHRIKEFLSHEDNDGVINQLIYMYTMSSSEIVGEYLLALSSIHDLNYMLRFKCASVVAENVNSFVDMSPDAYKKIKTMCGEDASFIFKKQVVFFYMENPRYLFSARKQFMTLIKNTKYPEDIRYKLLLDVETLNIGTKAQLFYISSGIMYFVYNSETMYKNLACQYGLQKFKNTENKLYEKYFADILMHLIDTCYNAEYNCRADAADILLNCELEYFKEIGRETIHFLSKGKEYYTNQQNVHVKSIEKSCEENLEKLLSRISLVPDLETCKTEFGVDEKIKDVINRIECDKAKYTKHNLTLAGIFCRVWMFVKHHEHSKILRDRLYEELYESKDVCSSGFMARMINSLSGFDGFGVGIDYSDQISAYFKQRMNKLISELPDNDILLSELAEGGGPNIRSLIIKNMSVIYSDLEKEFLPYITETDFDLYFKRAYVEYYD